MTVNDRQLEDDPSCAGFGPVLNVGHSRSVALAGSAFMAPWPARIGALVAGFVLAIVVLIIPTFAIALTVAQVNPSLTVRNAPSSQNTQPGGPEANLIGPVANPVR